MKLSPLRRSLSSVLVAGVVVLAAPAAQADPIPVSTTTSVTSSLNPSFVGAPVFFSATVCPDPGGTAPTGSVQFAVDGTDLGTPVSLSGDDANHCSTATSVSTSTLTGTPSAHHAVAATYTPADGGFSGSSGSLDQIVGVLVGGATTTTSLTSSANPSRFGDAVSFVAKVCPTSGIAPATGTVQFVVDGWNFGGPVALGGFDANLCAAATSPPVSGLPVGNHAITATALLNGDLGPSGGAVTQAVNCGSVLTPTPGKAVSVSSGSVCIRHADVDGNLVVRGGASVYLLDAHVIGNFQALRAGTIVVCDSRVDNNAIVAFSTGFVLLGADGMGNCPGDTVNGNLLVKNNAGGVRVAGTSVGRVTTMKNNSATGVDPTSLAGAALIVSHNDVGALACTGNVPPPSDAGGANTVSSGRRTGQCQAPFA